jgi:hypothetical protein
MQIIVGFVVTGESYRQCRRTGDKLITSVMESMKIRDKA